MNEHLGKGEKVAFFARISIDSFGKGIHGNRPFIIVFRYVPPGSGRSGAENGLLTAFDQFFSGFLILLGSKGQGV